MSSSHYKTTWSSVAPLVYFGVGCAVCASVVTALAVANVKNERIRSQMARDAESKERIAMLENYVRQVTEANSVMSAAALAASAPAVEPQHTNSIEVIGATLPSPALSAMPAAPQEPAAVTPAAPAPLAHAPSPSPVPPPAKLASTGKATATRPTKDKASSGTGAVAAAQTPEAPSPEVLAAAVRARAASEAATSVQTASSTQPAVSTPARDPSDQIEAVPAAKAGVYKLESGAVVMLSGKKVKVGQAFDSGETLVAVDSVSGKVVTSRRTLMLH